MVDTARDETAVVKGTSVTVEAHAVMLLRFGLDRRIRALEEPRREPLTLVDKHTL